MTPRIITAAERAQRRGPSAPAKLIAAFRKKGCTTCKPIPVFSRPAQPNPPSSLHANPSHPPPGSR